MELWDVSTGCCSAVICQFNPAGTSQFVNKFVYLFAIRCNGFIVKLAGGAITPEYNTRK